MNRVLLLIALAFYGVMAFAQENGLNPIYRIQFKDLVYKAPAKKTTAGSVIGVIVETAAGKVSDTHHENKVPAVNAKIKAALSDVRRIITMETSNAKHDVLISGEITNISTTTETETVETKDKKGKVHKELRTSYDATIGVTLTLTWLADGVVETHSFTSKGYTGYYLSSTEKALEDALENLREKVTSYFNGLFPISANIVERGTEKKDKQKEVYLDVGALNAVGKGMHFNVFVIGKVAGRETKTQIGKLKVTDVLGDDVCLCKVQSGGKNIKIALDENKRVLAISKD